MIFRILFFLIYVISTKVIDESLIAQHRRELFISSHGVDHIHCKGDDSSKSSGEEIKMSSSCESGYVVLSVYVGHDSCRLGVVAMKIYLRANVCIVMPDSMKALIPDGVPSFIRNMFKDISMTCDSRQITVHVCSYPQPMYKVIAGVVTTPRSFRSQNSQLQNLDFGTCHHSTKFECEKNRIVVKRYADTRCLLIRQEITFSNQCVRLHNTDISDDPQILEYLNMIGAVSITCNHNNVYLVTCAENNPYHYTPEVPGFATENWRQTVEKEIVYNVCQNTRTDGSDMVGQVSRSPACIGTQFGYFHYRDSHCYHGTRESKAASFGVRCNLLKDSEFSKFVLPATVGAISCGGPFTIQYCAAIDERGRGYDLKEAYDSGTTGWLHHRPDGSWLQLIERCVLNDPTLIDPNIVRVFGLSRQTSTCVEIDVPPPTTKKPTNRPTHKPVTTTTKKPTRRPTRRTTKHPSQKPTVSSPTYAPSFPPTFSSPSESPSKFPMAKPTTSTTTNNPSEHPSDNPSSNPSEIIPGMRTSNSTGDTGLNDGVGLAVGGKVKIFLFSLLGVFLFGVCLICCRKKRQPPDVMEVGLLGNGGGLEIGSGSADFTSNIETEKPKPPDPTAVIDLPLETKRTPERSLPGSPTNYSNRSSRNPEKV